jgi:hypothetical protein
VAAATGPRARALPRASATLTAPLATGRGSAASANGDLWLLTGQSDEMTLRELAVPHASNAGARLLVTSHGDLSGPAALESATVNPDGTGGSVLALASDAGIELISPDGTQRRLTFAIPPGLDQVLPVTNLQGRIAFLLHGEAGWSLATAATDARTLSVRTLDALPGTAPLVTPAASGGRLYTMRADGAGTLWQISTDGSASTIPGAKNYPVLTGEKLDLTGAEIRADNSRVIFNARANFEDEVIFTDGSHLPLAIDKHSAVQLDPSGTEALVVSHQTGTGTGKHAAPKPTRTAQPHPAQAVDDKVDCDTATQTPHIPVVQLLERGSRSVQLAWTYPLLDAQDCVPSTYTVSTQAVIGGGPAPPGTLTVQGQDGVNLVGLFPDTTYRVVVTAYLNGRGTSSLPLKVRTSIEGPAAPTGVSAQVDAAGNWLLTWGSCGGISSACVASTSWQVIASYCDGLGLGAAPPTRLLVGDPTQHSFDYTYAGSEALLGRGLNFQVAGVGDTGVIGTAAASTGCQYSWMPPRPSAITLDASAPATIAEDNAAGTSDTTVSAHFADGQSADLGGVGGQLTYQLLRDGSVVQSVGPTTAPTATLHGISAGAHYQVQAIVSPHGHPEASATIGPVDVQPALAVWPQPSVAASFTDTSASAGTLNVTVSLPAGTDTEGETFDLDDASLDCGNAHLELDHSNVSADSTISFPDIQRATYNSSCTVSAQLAQNAGSATSPPLYGAGISPRATSGTVSIDPPALDTSASDFSASWVASAVPDDPQIAVSYTGDDDLITTYAHDWTSTASTDATSACGSTTSSPTGSPAVIDVDRGCVTSSAVWSVQVSFTYFGATGTYSIPVSGSKPAPVDPTQMSFAAVWTPDSTVADAQVQLQYTGPYDDAVLGSLNWTITVTSSGDPGVTCGSSNDAPKADGSGPDISVDLSACPATSGSTVATYTVEVSFTDPNYGSTGSYPVTVTGTAPQ